MSAPIVFLDTETTGLSLDDDIWEFAGIRRDPDGTEHELHLFIEHDPAKCANLPESFLRDHQARWPALNDAAYDQQVSTRHHAAVTIEQFTAGAHIVGAVPNFDTERLSLLLTDCGADPSWHYHLIDVENLAVGYLYGRYGNAANGGRPLEAEGEAVDLPWDSDDLSLALGVKPPGEGVRHTAMGDARWAMALYDEITGDGP